MDDILPGTIHRKDVGSILRRLIYSYKAQDKPGEIYLLEIQLTLSSGDYGFILPDDKAELEKRLSGLDEWACLSFPKIGLNPYVIRKVDIVGESYSCIERV